MRLNSNKDAGFTLIEITLALLILLVGVLGVAQLFYSFNLFK
ncbi:MAG: prepilin-type N-terminal cleavage/methylation domain-containing protein [Blastocatellia bacterium]|nr:prepilin-type N-terminal cleavage/methylation domain-containing protein [Blastocatellia bacterium]